MQRDRIEVEVVAWGRHRESWSVDYRVLHGDPAKAGVWNKLGAMLEERFPHAATGAGMVIERMAVDSGYATQEVYAWSRTAPLGRVMPIKGVDKSRFPIQGPSDVEVRPEEAAKWQAEVVEVNSGRLAANIPSWQTGVNVNVPGRQTIRVLGYYGGAVRYREVADQVVAGDYKELIFR